MPPITKGIHISARILLHTRSGYTVVIKVLLKRAETFTFTIGMSSDFVCVCVCVCVCERERERERPGD